MGFQQIFSATQFTDGGNLQRHGKSFLGLAAVDGNLLENGEIFALGNLFFMFFLAHRREQKGVSILPDKAALAVHAGELSDSAGTKIIQPDVVAVSVGFHVAAADGKRRMGAVRRDGKSAEELVLGKKVQRYFFH